MATAMAGTLIDHLGPLPTSMNPLRLWRFGASRSMFCLATVGIQNVVPNPGIPMCSNTRSWTSIHGGSQDFLPTSSCGPNMSINLFWVPLARNSRSPPAPPASRPWPQVNPSLFCVKRWWERSDFSDTSLTSSRCNDIMIFCR